MPLTCDLQDGYGERLGEVMSEVLGMGVVGCNIEDANVVDGKDGEFVFLRNVYCARVGLTACYVSLGGCRSTGRADPGGDEDCSGGWGFRVRD